MRNILVAAVGGLLAVSWFACGSILRAADARPAPQTDRAVLAWVRFVDAEESYDGAAYLWLGKFNVNLRIDLEPQPGHVLELLWGSKNDQREAIITLNGRQLTATGGGYDGFRWMSVPVPGDVSGTHYEVTFRKGLEKPAFLAEIRLIPGATTTTASTRCTCSMEPRRIARPFGTCSAISKNTSPTIIGEAPTSTPTRSKGPSTSTTASASNRPPIGSTAKSRTCVKLDPGAERRLIVTASAR